MEGPQEQFSFRGRLITALFVAFVSHEFKAAPRTEQAAQRREQLLLVL